ncbi:MAG: hypothetical protein J1F61_00745 [Clostridiales bacterium]|nr:hypothetical protein [Clostridiales bacterium]
MSEEIRKECKKQLDICDMSLRISTLEKNVALFSNIARGYSPSSEELKTALRSSIKELCRAVCDFVDSF